MQTRRHATSFEGLNSSLAQQHASYRGAK